MKSLAAGRLLQRFLSSALGRFTSAAVVASGLLAGLAAVASASELDLKIPPIDTTYTMFGMQVTGLALMYGGFAICIVGDGLPKVPFSPWSPSALIMVPPYRGVRSGSIRALT